MAVYIVKQSSSPIPAIACEARSHRPIAERERISARVRIDHVHIGLRQLCDLEERQLFYRWARAVVAIYGVLIALAFTVLACLPAAQSSGPRTSQDAAPAAGMPTTALTRSPTDR